MKTTKTYTLVITETVATTPYVNEEPKSSYSYTIVRPNGTTRTSMSQSDEFTYMLGIFGQVIEGKD